jgi:DNA-directed RNA polymerase subunit RPC12/RpoP
MEVKLLCARCGRQWTVVRWSPTAMSCPTCGSGSLGNARGLIETQQRLAKRDAAEHRKPIEQAQMP